MNLCLRGWFFTTNQQYFFCIVFSLSLVLFYNFVIFLKHIMIVFSNFSNFPSLYLRKDIWFGQFIVFPIQKEIPWHSRRGLSEGEKSMGSMGEFYQEERY